MEPTVKNPFCAIPLRIGNYICAKFFALQQKLGQKTLKKIVLSPT
jgi:hypothetical protein